MVTAALASYVRHIDPDHFFTAVALFADLQTKPHRDVNNEPDIPNLLIPLSSFQDGQVWQHAERGSSWQRLHGQDLPGPDGSAVPKRAPVRRPLPGTC